MYKKTKYVTEIQQSGTDELKPLFFTADPSPARALHINMYLEGAEEGSPENKQLLVRADGIYVSDGSDFTAVVEPGSDNDVGSVNWKAILASDGSTGPITFGIHAGYGTQSGGSSGTYTVNWKIRLEVEEFD